MNEINREIYSNSVELNQQKTTNKATENSELNQENRVDQLSHERLSIVEVPVSQPVDLKTFLSKVIVLNDQINKINEKIRELEGDMGKIKLRTPHEKMSEEEGYMALNAALTHGLYEKLMQEQESLKRQYKEQLSVLTSQLPQNEQHRQFTAEELKLIFEAESQIRMNVEKNPLNREDYQKLYDERVLPLVQQAKLAIKQRPIHFSAQAAASKGTGAQAGLQALKKFTQNTTVIKDNKVSVQKVFLHPEEGVVFKKGGPVAEEEESITNSLFELISPQVTVGSFTIRNPSPKLFGIEVPHDVQKRGLPLETLSPALDQEIREKLSDQDRRILDGYQLASHPKEKESVNHIERPKIKRTWWQRISEKFTKRRALQKSETVAPLLKDEDLDKYNYQLMEKKTWWIEIPGKEKKRVTLQELKKLDLLSYDSPENIFISSPDFPRMSLDEHSFQHSPFFRALTYSQKKSPPVILTPDLSHPVCKKAYEICEKFTWSYTDENGKTKTVDFKTFHAHRLEKKVMKDVFMTGPANISPSVKQIQTALKVPWKIFAPDLLQASDNSISKIEDIQAKPFMWDMILMHDLEPAAREKILMRLTDEAQFNAIITAELQFFDLHSKNLGVEPEPNVQYEEYKRLQFIFPPENEKFNFKTVMSAYLQGYIREDTVIRFTKDGIVYHKALKELKELQQALNVRWRLVIFDTDKSLSEDNRLLEVNLSNRGYRHLLPLRSVLLETKEKNRPLSDAVIQRLIDSDDRDKRVKQWTRKEDAPIYKRLSPSARAIVKQQVAPIIKKYELGKNRRRGDIVTVKDLTDRFADEMVNNLTHSSILQIWKNLEEDLSSVVVRPGDTWETLAQRYHQDVNELEKLNSHKKLNGGEKIKISYDLTSSSSEALKNRRKIAGQLFPRITSRQQAALLERQKHRKEYLLSYRALSQSTLLGQPLMNEIERYLSRDKATSLSSERRNNLQQQLREKKQFFLDNPHELSAFKQKICKECAPSYFNLAKAMYPLLADTYELAEAVYKNHETAGKAMGFLSIEDIINDAHKDFPKESPQVKLAERLKNRITGVREPAFYHF